MLWWQFIWQNTHFAVHLLAALTMFAVFWLYFDAWIDQRSRRELFRIGGFFLLSLGFLLAAVHMESSITTTPLLGLPWGTWADIIRLFGYGALIAGQYLEPLMPKPSVYSPLSGVFLFGGLTLPALSWYSGLKLAFPILAALAALLYWRRATIGLENHIKRVGVAFYILAVAELVGTAGLFRSTTSVGWYQAVAPFGIFWLLEHGLLVIAMVLIGRWVAQYLLKRMQTQLFMIFVTGSVMIFVVTVVAFTGLLVKSLQTETIRRLESDAQILNYAIDSFKAATLADAQVLTQNPMVAQGIAGQSYGELRQVAESYLTQKQTGSVVILDPAGKVMARGEDPERLGDSWAVHPLVVRALAGEAVVTVTAAEGAVAPTVWIQAAAPVLVDTKVAGVVMVGRVIDEVFVDGVKKATGLETAVYGGKILTATTLGDRAGNHRPLVGVVEYRPEIIDRVLVEGESYAGLISFISIPYYAAFAPLTDADEVPVGMVMAGTPQMTVFTMAAEAMEFTFLITVGLMVLSIFPAYRIARSLVRQLR